MMYDMIGLKLYLKFIFSPSCFYIFSNDVHINIFEYYFMYL